MLRFALKHSSIYNKQKVRKSIRRDSAINAAGAKISSSARVHECNWTAVKVADTGKFDPSALWFNREIVPSKHYLTLNTVRDRVNSVGNDFVQISYIMIFVIFFTRNQFTDAFRCRRDIVTYSKACDLWRSTHSCTIRDAHIYFCEFLIADIYHWHWFLHRSSCQLRNGTL